MNVEKLVFIDETWTSASMTRRYGRAPQGQALLRFGSARALEDDYPCGSPAPQTIDCANGHRWTDGRRDVSCLFAEVLVRNTPARGHRNHRQSQQSQGGQSPGSHRCGGRNFALSSAVFARLESYRKALLQTQGAT